jgi:CheY-like chemotaxis protein
LKEEELERLTATIQAIDELLRNLTNFRPYPRLLDRTDDPVLQDFLDHVVADARDARLLSAKALECLDEIQADLEAARQPLVEDDFPSDEPEPLPLIRPPADLERITMANPAGMREVVLVIDHSPETLQQVETILTDEDYRVISVQDGFSAISTYGRLWAAIDLVMISFDMPDMSGEDIFEELLAINPQAVTVVSYGDAPPEKSKLNQMLTRGLSGFLPKPYEREKIIRQIQSVLTHRSARGG